MTLDMIFAIVTLLLVGYYGLKDAGVLGRSVKTSGPATVVRPRPYRSERGERVQRRSAQQNAVNAGSAVQALNAPATTVGALNISPKELTQLAEAIKFHAAGQSKQAAIEAAFQCSKGGGKAWKRACELWAIAMGEG